MTHSQLTALLKGVPYYLVRRRHGASLRSCPPPQNSPIFVPRTHAQNVTLHPLSHLHVSKNDCCKDVSPVCGSTTTAVPNYVVGSIYLFG